MPYGTKPSLYGAGAKNTMAKRVETGVEESESRSGKPPNVKAARKAGQRAAIKGL